MKRFALVSILAAALTGCASTDYNAYLKAQPGQQITGLASVSMYRHL